MKKKVTNVSYRKDSETFPKWMKYEIEILNENGTIEIIPAYGKDLQDALSRVKHDMVVGKLEDKLIKRIPENTWVILWFLGMALLSSSIYYTNGDKYVGWYIMGAIMLYTITTISVSNWFQLRNRDL
tara:strand:- start:329 stop:709 length:381 start_codon:yes stop_codon:yes gene_type:complete